MVAQRSEDCNAGRLADRFGRESILIGMLGAQRIRRKNAFKGFGVRDINQDRLVFEERRNKKPAVILSEKG